MIKRVCNYINRQDGKNIQATQILALQAQDPLCVPIGMNQEEATRGGGTLSVLIHITDECKFALN